MEVAWRKKGVTVEMKVGNAKIRRGSDKRIRQDRLVVFLCLFFFVVACGTLSWAAAYTIYNTDDFSLAKECLEYGTTNPVFKAIQMTIDSWLHWGGHYFSSFLYYSLNPLIGMGAFQLRVLMIFNCVLLCGAVFFFFYSMLGTKKYGGISIILLSTCTLWAFLDYKSWTEVLFWFSGAFDYSIELSLLLIAFGLFFMGYARKNNVGIAVALFILFFACGGNQTVAMAAFSCFLLLFVDILFMNRRFDYRMIFVIIAFLLPLLNLLAPGNFARADLLGDSSFLKSVFYSIRIFVMETERLFKDSMFFILLLIVFSWSYKENSHIGYIRLFDVVSLWFVAISVSFLACFGYNSPYLPNRTFFVVDLFVVIGFVLLAAMVGERLKRRVEAEGMSKLVLPITMLMFLVTMVLMPYRIENGIIYKLGIALGKGEIQDYYREVSMIYNQIENSDEDIVVIAELPKPVDGFVEVWLSANEDDYRYLGNQEIGAYYGKTIIVSNPEKN